MPEASKEEDVISISHAGRLCQLVRSESNILSHPVELSQTVERSHGGRRETDCGASSSVSVDAPQRI